MSGWGLFDCQGIHKQDHRCLQIYSDNLITDLPDTARICNELGRAITWLMLEWPVNILPIPEVFNFFGSTLSQCNDRSSCWDSQQSKRDCTPDFTLLHCSSETAVLQVIQNCF